VTHENQNLTRFDTLQGNASKVCVCFAGYSGINCGSYIPYTDTSAVIGGALGTAAVVGIVIGVVVAVAGAGSGGSYAYSQLGGGGGVAVIGNNPIYSDTGLAGHNPLNKKT